MPKIDLTNYEGGREQAFVKHYLLEKYLSKWGFMIGSEWDTLVFVDGFAGPWETKDAEFADASFGIALRTLADAVDGLFKIRGIRVQGACIFVEKNKEAFKRLNAFAKQQSTSKVKAIALEGLFRDHIKAINEFVASVGANPFKFVFLDQKGWAGTPISDLRPFVQERPCELLFNLMTSHLTRFIDRNDLAPSYNELFGRDGVVERIRALPKGKGEREEKAVEEYCITLREVCKFRHVSRAVILDPQKESVRYYLIFATNSLHGIQVFKNAEFQAAQIQDEVRFKIHVKKSAPPLPGLFDDAPKSRLSQRLKDRYCRQARAKVIDLLLKNVSAEGIEYEELYSGAMEFPLVTQDDLERWLNSFHPFIKNNLQKSANRPNPRKPSLFKGDRVIVCDFKRLMNMRGDH